jgi:hypothetical protein
MRRPISRLLFDRNDQQLLDMLDDIRGRTKSGASLESLLNPYLHPHGIKELAAPPGLRLAVSMLHFLDTLEVGKSHERVAALRSARAEVLSATCGQLRNNASRVLLQVMKELIRTREDRRRQMELAHDFRMARSGKPRIIRSLLHRYQLLEMPEAWNQIAFDDHVHDAYTKGRKSPTHLIMDAWIKGIRHLTVVYYNYIEPEAASELLEAARIMRMTVRIGLSVSARFRNRFVPFIWVPGGFADTGSFLNFLDEKPLIGFMAQGRQVTAYRAACVLKALQAFNMRHRCEIERSFDIRIPSLSEEDFISFVGAGQMSDLHLAEFIHMHLFPLMQARVNALKKTYDRTTGTERACIEGLVKEMNALDSEAILERYLQPHCNPDIPNPNIPRDASDEPELLQSKPHDLLARITEIHPSYRITMIPGGLTDADILELLYDCGGMITHLEIFNLKDYTAGKKVVTEQISKLQLALNEGDAIAIKRVIQNIIEQQDASADSPPEQKQKLRAILHDIPGLMAGYREAPLAARIGSDSTGRYHHLQGMGLAIMDTLPVHTRKEIRTGALPYGKPIPVVTRAYLRETFIPRKNASNWLNRFHELLRSLPGLHLIGQKRRQEWVEQSHSTYLNEPGNIVTLSVEGEGRLDKLSFYAPPRTPQRVLSWKYLNSSLKTALKVGFGFIPAFLTFYLSKDWWVLAYGGAFIWFGITGLRNIIQSVLGGGGLRRAPLLHWKDYVSWERLGDSLMFTGFSVPLLDYFTKTLLLEGGLGITASSNPVFLYAVMALVNGLYLSGHNSLRGLQRAAIVGSAFRSILSIPIAVALNAGIGTILTAAGIAGAHGILQQWAAVISKLASDTVAAVIEGLADRFDNLNQRARDYAEKLPQLLDALAGLELLYPEQNVPVATQTATRMPSSASSEARALEDIIIINVLDLMYFWMYQPRAQYMLREQLRLLPEEKRKILLQTQFILQRREDVIRLLQEGLLGRHKKRALAFYEQGRQKYLKDMEALATS